MTVPIVITAAGAQPQTPAALRAQLLTDVAAVRPGYTATLPSSMIEDISSTDVYAILLCDAAWVEFLNSITPFDANPFLLNKLGQVYGVDPTALTNTSVDLVFSGTIGFPIAQGFIVSDGTYQYVVQDGGIIGSGGISLPLFAVSTTAGSWAVAPNTVAQLVTQPPSTISLAVTNPTSGVPGGPAQSEQSFRADVMQAGLATAQGMATFLKTQLRNVPNVQGRLISVRQQPNNGGWEVLVGGGDPYFVAYAIFRGLFDINTLVGSTIAVTAITKANPGKVTTNLNHGFATGQTGVQLNGVVGMTAVNGVPFTITVVDEKNFTIGVDTSGYPAYVSGGVVTPNLRNEVVAINDYPDVYTIPFVNPPQQTVTVTVLWNTTSLNFVSNAAMSQLATPALVAYINSLAPGQPMNTFVMGDIFTAAIATILPAAQLTRLVFEVSINGVGTSPVAGTGIVNGDPESYFLTNDSLITVEQG